MKDRLEGDFAKLGKALARLRVAASWPLSHDGRTEASIQCLEFVVELYWKLLQHMLREKEALAGTPRDALRAAFTAGWIDDEELWVRMLKDRNLSSHTYNEALAAEIVARIPGYLPVLETTYHRLYQLAEKEFPV